MKLTPRFIIRAGLVLSAAGAIGAFGACRDKGGTEPIVPPSSPPPPGAPAAPINVQATAASETAIDVTWTDASSNEDGFKIESCSGAGCSTFAEVGSVAANATTFSNTGLTASTEYSYRVIAFNTTGASTPTTPVKATTKPLTTPPPVGVVMVGAGEITTCNVGQSVATAGLVDAIIAQNPDAIVFTAGNNLDAPAGASTSYQNCFDPNWGRFKSRMRVAVGTGDYSSVGQDAMYGYFGDRVAAPNGWYSFEAGNWHVIVLNTTTWQWGENNITGDRADQPRPMFDWLAADLAAVDSKKCIMAISWERRLYTSGTGTLGKNSTMNHIAQMLYNAGADILVSAKDKQYQRFPQTNPDGVVDPARGFAQFIVGTGGRTLDVNHDAAAGNPVVAQMGSASPNKTWGVIKFTLNADNYQWEFVPTTAGAFTDQGQTACHN